MTNPYEAILTHDPSRSCVRITPDMLHSLKPQEDPPDVPDGIDILYPPDSGKTHLSQVSLWSIMSDRPSYTIHPQPSGLAGSGCMDFSIDRFNRQSPSVEEELQLTFEGIEPSDYLTYQPNTVAELNINRSYDDLLDVSTTQFRPRSYTEPSPVMLVARKSTKNKRPVVDFRLLNTRIMRRNTATPLLRDIFKMLGRSKCEVLFCVDLKDAFHSFKS